MDDSVLSSFLEVCERAPSRALVTFVDARGNDKRTLRACELAKGAQSVACALRPTKASGYWGLDEETEQTFRATVMATPFSWASPEPSARPRAARCAA
jgi:hypothetical protein